jgi:CHAT domain-containing protein
VVAHEALQYVPFAALPWDAGAGSRPLLASREIVRIPSATALAALRDRPPPAPPTRAILVIADPVFSQTDSRVAPQPRTGPDSGQPSIQAPGPLEALSRGGVETRELRRLPASRDEAEDIVRAAGEDVVTLLSGFEARKERVLGTGTTGYRIIHIASHGLVDGEHPELSAVVLSLVDRNGRPLDGLLLLNDIHRMKLGADLVVLSACDTALGRDIKGEGIVGFTRGFLHAGARRVIGTLWKVDDRATRELMRRFYERLLRQNETVGTALREAQLSMAAEARWAFPYYWAGFELHGDWR